IAWAAVLSVTVPALTGLLARAGPPSTARQRHGAVSARALWDLVPMFLAATAIRTLLAGGIQLRGHFLQQASLGSLLAASVNNLPAAAALHTTSVGAAWAGVLAMAIGPNLVITGSV